MKYGIAKLSVAPCRAEAADSSEQVTQLLFGETIKIYEKKRSWYRVKTAHDNYECWMDENQFEFITQRRFEELQESKPNLVADVVDVIKNEDTNEVLPILVGCNLIDYKDTAFSFLGNKCTSGPLFLNGQPL